MWIKTVLDVIALLTGIFFYEIKIKAIQIANEGGMINKYQDLIENLNNLDSRSRIFKETSDSVTLGVSKMSGTILFLVIQTFDNVTVVCIISNSIFDKHKIEWEFPEYGNQKRMAEEIFYDLEKYNQNLLSNPVMR